MSTHNVFSWRNKKKYIYINIFVKKNRCLLVQNVKQYLNENGLTFRVENCQNFCPPF